MMRGRDRIRSALNKQTEPWIIGFSGGKDSTAMLSLLIQLHIDGALPSKPIYILYCDTGVEIPPARELTIRMMETIESKYPSLARCIVAKPAIEDSFFVKIIGRGYPPPTNKFRWCTDKIRIRPVERAVSNLGLTSYELLLGARLGESQARDRVLFTRSTPDEGYFISANSHATRNFLPIYDYVVDEVWETIIQNEHVLGVHAAELLGLYHGASGECPLLVDPIMPPCGSARFGCWSCTVVSKDKTTESLIRNGQEDLKPLNNFRNWLNAIRAIPELRWPHRRNGAIGLGPFTVEARKQILNELRSAEKSSGHLLITDAEILRIEELWAEDLLSNP
jgi:DNA sulfur modification protein DndC